MKTKDKTIAQEKTHSSAHTVSSNAIQKKAIGVVQKMEPEEEIQQHQSDGTVQKMDAPELDEEHPVGLMQQKTQGQMETTHLPLQRKENKTGMPDNLKTGVENLSGMSMDHVKVHYNSSQPAQLNALAYAQGSNIHIGPGQEKHLPHEAWHVVQQAQGRVQATTQMKAGVPVNDDPGLEHEADVMGEKAMQMKNTVKASSELKTHRTESSSAIQRMSLVQARIIEEEYGLTLNDGQRQRLQDPRFTPALYNVLRNNIGDFRALAPDFGTFMRLCMFLINGGTPGFNAGVLIRINNFFGSRFATLHNNRTVMQYDAFMGIVTGANATHQMYFQVFFTSRIATRPADLFLIDCMDMLGNSLAVGNNVAFFNVIQNAVTNGREISLNAGNIADTVRIIAAHPPAGGFPGFTRWGEGNYGGSAANLSGHFLKHVMSLDGGTTAEALLWWAALNINPTFAQLSTALAHQNFTGPENNSIFGNIHPAAGATPNGIAGLTYLIEHGITDYPALRGFFIAHYENTYGTHVINQSTALNNLAVHESHDGIFVSGSVGNLFIIGRLDAGGGAMGISSGYFATNIASKLDRQILWHL